MGAGAGLGPCKGCGAIVPVPEDWCGNCYGSWCEARREIPTCRACGDILDPAFDWPTGAHDACPNPLPGGAK